ncbi:MAG: hypothetical protein B7Z37_05410 [Verrucomicrobia bacterium 12-59-8]|nr:MAG: hypothetical protein B7Z37_05410 [Verrucomicrobia bacterium 12-59-8]
MDWIRENKPLAAIFGVIIVGSLALGYLLFDAWSTYDENKEAYLGLGGQVAGLEGARLAPTEANRKAKQAQVEEYANVVTTLGKTLLILQPPTQPINDIEFQDKLKAKISDVRKAVQSKMQLPAEFAFGFDEYTRTLPKSAAAATELYGYLEAMDEIIKLFLKCNVQSVDLLERSKLPIETQKAQTPQQGNNAGMQGQASAAILEKRQISVNLTLDQGALQLLVGGLASPSEMPYFTSLRLLRIENQRQDGPLRSEVRLPSPAAANPNVANSGGAKEPASDEIKPPDPAFPDTIPVFGQELLKVRLEIDLVKFLNR